MPSISMFYGIIVYMLFKDNKRHNLPHIHVKYSEYKAVFDIKNCKLLDGKLPPKETKMVETWILLRQPELLANWELALEGEALYKIEPLR